MIKIKNPLHKKIALFIDVCGSIFYRWGCLCHLWVRKDINLDDFIPRKILVVVIEPLGDVLMSTPVFRALKSKYPATYLSVLISSAGREIIANNPYIDEVITEDCPWLYSRPITLSGLLQQLKYFLFSYWKMYNKIKAAKYDLGIDLRGDFRHILFFLFG